MADGHATAPTARGRPRPGRPRAARRRPRRGPDRPARGAVRAGRRAVPRGLGRAADDRLAPRPSRTARAGGCGSARSRSRDVADTLRGAYLETRSVPKRTWPRGEVYWHEVIGVTGPRPRRHASWASSRTSTASPRTRSTSSAAGRTATFDLPAVRAFIRIFAPRRGEIVVDAEALDLQPPKARRDRCRSTAGAAADVARRKPPLAAPKHRIPLEPTDPADAAP